jgi:hypothetical protein
VSAALQIIAISCNNRREHMQRVWQNTEFLNVAGGGTHSYNWVLKDYR